LSSSPNSWLDGFGVLAKTAPNLPEEGVPSPIRYNSAPPCFAAREAGDDLVRGEGGAVRNLAITVTASTRFGGSAGILNFRGDSRPAFSRVTGSAMWRKSKHASPWGSPRRDGREPQLNSLRREVGSGDGYIRFVCFEIDRSRIADTSFTLLR